MRGTPIARGVAPMADRPPVEPIDLTQYVREALDGVVGDIDLPARFSFASGDVGKDGFTPEQRAVYAQLERAIAARFRRHLTWVEQLRLGMALIGEWNRRARGAA